MIKKVLIIHLFREKNLLNNKCSRLMDLNFEKKIIKNNF